MADSEPYPECRHNVVVYRVTTTLTTFKQVGSASQTLPTTLSESTPPISYLLMRVLKMFLFSVLFTTGLAMAQAPSVEPYNAPEPCLTIEACVNHYAYKYDVDEAMMFKIIKCESSNYKWAHNKTEKEDSWGWVQINTAAHDVSIAQATDLEFAVNFLADNLSKGNAPQMWYTCYRKQYDKT